MQSRMRRHQWRVLLTSLILLLFCSIAQAQNLNTDTFVTNYINALNASMPPSGDPSIIANMFTENGVHHGVNQGPPQVGREQIRQFFSGFKNGLSDWTHVERGRVIQSNRAAWEGTAEGHDKATGKYLKLPIVFFFDFDDQGKAREVRVFVDVHLIDEQLKAASTQ